MLRPSTRVLFPLLLAGMLVLALPGAARADVWLVPFAGVKFGGSTSIIDLELAATKKKLVLGVAARFVNDGFIGYEIEFGNMGGYFENEEARDRPLVKQGSYVMDLTGSLVFTLPPRFT